MARRPAACYTYAKATVAQAMQHLDTIRLFAIALLMGCAPAPDAGAPQPAPAADENRCFATLPPLDAPGAFDTPFETLCPAELTTDRIATLQRALQARLAYLGPITGAYDGPTRAAVLALQTPLGLPSGQLARSTAEMLGIVPVRDTRT